VAEENSCANTLPLSEWVKHPGKVCRPCTLPLLANWYVSELEESGDRVQSDRIKRISEDPDITPEALAAELDDIKKSVSSSMRERLKEFDCSVQSNE
jgi:hypothetical protein